MVASRARRPRREARSSRTSFREAPLPLAREETPGIERERKCARERDRHEDQEVQGEKPAHLRPLVEQSDPEPSSDAEHGALLAGQEQQISRPGARLRVAEKGAERRDVIRIEGGHGDDAEALRDGRLYGGGCRDISRLRESSVRAPRVGKGAAPAQEFEQKRRPPYPRPAVLET